jgi:hypothetical protein
MHLDSSYVAFGSAVVTFATAVIGVVRLILEKKLKSVPRGIFVLLRNSGIPVISCGHPCHIKKLYA